MEEFYEVGATITHTQLKNEWMDVKDPGELMDLCERVNQLGCDGDITEGEMKRLMDQLMCFHNFFKEEEAEEASLFYDADDASNVEEESHTYIVDMLYERNVLSRDELREAYRCDRNDTIEAGAWMREFGHKVECPPYIYHDSPLSQEVVEDLYNCMLWSVFNDGRLNMMDTERRDAIAWIHYDLKKSERQAWVDEPGMVWRSMSDFEDVDEAFADNCEIEFDKAFKVYLEDRQEWMDQPDRPWREDFDWEWVDRMWGMGCGTTVRGEPVISSVRCRAVDKMWNEAIMEATSEA